MGCKLCRCLKISGRHEKNKEKRMKKHDQFKIDFTSEDKTDKDLETNEQQSQNVGLDSHKTQTLYIKDSDDESCAVSENSTYQPHMHHWSRNREVDFELPTGVIENNNDSSSKESSPDRFENDGSYHRFQIDRDISSEALYLHLPHEEAYDAGSTVEPLHSSNYSNSRESLSTKSEERIFQKEKLSDSECHLLRNCSAVEMKVKTLARVGSMNLGRKPRTRRQLRSASFQNIFIIRKEHKTKESDSENIKVNKSPVLPWQILQKRKYETEGTSIPAMTYAELNTIRRLASASLTAYTKLYCPTHHSVWNWELPKFIKKIIMPEYNDKKVFGVPLNITFERTGQILPPAIRAAFVWLELNASQTIGIFRKSAVKSRILQLKERLETCETFIECMNVFDCQEPYIVADIVKHYFRDLPESVLTKKMSVIFLAIFQDFPTNVRLEATQCAVLQLPDENCKVLYALLGVLTTVADKCQLNQMTANNLAICIAPSVFHYNISLGSTAKISQAIASRECLSFMIANYRQIFTASRDYWSS